MGLTFQRSSQFVKLWVNYFTVKYRQENERTVLQFKAFFIHLKNAAPTLKFINIL